MRYEKKCGGFVSFSDEVKKKWKCKNSQPEVLLIEYTASISIYGYMHMVLQSQRQADTKDTDGKQIIQEIYINQLFQKVFSITFFSTLLLLGKEREKKSRLWKNTTNFFPSEIYLFREHRKKITYQDQASKREREKRQRNGMKGFSQDALCHHWQRLFTCYSAFPPRTPLQHNSIRSHLPAYKNV